MPLVEVTEIVPAPAQRLWDAIGNVEAYPDLISHVRSLKLLEVGPGYRITAWEVDCKGFIMRWTEREESDLERLRIDFRQIDGDLSVFEGFWQLRPLGTDVSEVTLSVRFEIGVPMLSEMLNPFAELAIRQNSQKMLDSIASAVVPRPGVARDR